MGELHFDTRWRGSYIGLCAVLRLVVHLCALEERMLGPRYDVFGPWPVCTRHRIVKRYFEEKVVKLTLYAELKE